MAKRSVQRSHSQELLRREKVKEIQPLDIERFKSKRLATETKHDMQRAPASVNREFEMLSRVYNLAIEVGKADSNPCQRVKKFKRGQ